MANVIENPPDDLFQIRYPWGRWLDGQVWHLHQGKDFRSTPASFRAYVYAVASRRGLRVRTMMGRSECELIIQAAPVPRP